MDSNVATFVQAEGESSTATVPLNVLNPSITSLLPLGDLNTSGSSIPKCDSEFAEVDNIMEAAAVLAPLEQLPFFPEVPPGNHELYQIVHVTYDTIVAVHPTNGSDEIVLDMERLRKVGQGTYTLFLYT